MRVIKEIRYDKHYVPKSLEHEVGRSPVSERDKEFEKFVAFQEKNKGRLISNSGFLRCPRSRGL